MRQSVPSRRYRFADFEFREKTGELCRCGQDLHLPDQAGQVLLALLQASGDLVSREALKEQLWPDKIHGDREGGINAAVRKLRQVLGDDGEEPRIVGTLPRRGYRLLVPMECFVEDREGTATVPFEEPALLPRATEMPEGSAGLSASPRNPATLPSGTGSPAIPGLGMRQIAIIGATLVLFALAGAFLSLCLRHGVLTTEPDEVEFPGFVRVRAGQFLMGSPVSEENRMGDESQHLVTISRDFLMAQYDVTVGEWRDFTLATGYLTEVERMRNGWVVVDGVEQPRFDASWQNPYFPQTDLNPVVLVTWNDAIAFCNWRSTKEGLRPVYRVSDGGVEQDLDANGYRLPTESEWEYAARGGEQGAKHYTKYAGSDNFDEVAWCSRNSGGGTHPVGRKRPNAIGLYDMSGNVDQWCWDLYGAYPNAPATDPMGGTTGIWRVHRGGSWLASPGQYVRIAYRFIFKTETRTTIGFRVVRKP